MQKYSSVDKTMLRLRASIVNPQGKSSILTTSFCKRVQSQTRSRGSFDTSRSLATWSRLGKAFNYPSSLRYASQKSTGLFGVQELTNEYGFALMREKSLAEATRIVNTALDSPRSPELVRMFDNLSDTLCASADLAEFVRLSHPKEGFRNAAEETSLAISGFVEQLNTNKQLHDALQDVLTNHCTGVDEETRRVAELFLFDFEQSGIHLDKSKQKLFVQLQQAALVIGGQFTHGASVPVMVPLRKCPDGIAQCFPTNGSKVKIDTLFLDSQSEKLREFTYKTYLDPVNSQLKALDLLILARHKLAQVVNFPTFSHRALNGTMVKTPDNVKDFLELAATMLEKPAMKEFGILTNLKKLDGGQKLSDMIMPWDLQYYTALAKSQSLKLNSTSLSAYFALGACMEGLNMVFQSLYGVTVEPVEAEKGEIWADEVQKLCVIHEKEGLLGYIYCDFFVRDDKLQQDSHFTIRG